MALFKATIKSTRVNNGVRLEKGMSVDFPSTYGAPMSTNGGHAVADGSKTGIRRNWSRHGTTTVALEINAIMLKTSV